MKIHLLAMSLLLGLTQAHAVTTQFLEDTDAKHFKAGKYENLVISNRGTITVSLKTDTLLKDRKDVSAVYAVARLPDGAVVAGTGPNGLVLKQVGDKWNTLLKTDQPYVVSLAVGKTGKVYAGTAGSAGKIFEIAPDGTSKLIFSEKNVKYIWALTLLSGRGGKLLAATGPAGNVYQIDAAGTKSVFSCKQKNVIAMAAAGDGKIYLGTDTAGIVYALDPKDDGFASRALYDANEDQIAAITVADDGSVYFATTSGRAAPGQAKAFLKKPAGVPATQTKPGTATSDNPAPKAAMGMPPGMPQRPPGRPPTPPGKPSAKGSAVYRIDRTGFVTEVFRDKLDFCSLIYHNDALYAGTWPDGWVFEIHPDSEEIITAAKADAKFVYAMTAADTKELLLATGSPGAVMKLGPQLADKATFTSRVLDTKQPARWGYLAAEFDRPCSPGVCATVQTRTGAVKDEKDPAWSEWSKPKCLDTPYPIDSPHGRFIQYKITFGAKGDKAAAVDSIKIAYMHDNHPPHIAALAVQTNPKKSPPRPPRPQAAPAKAKTWKITWKATDPNSDKLTYRVHVRLIDTQFWIELAKDHKPPNYAFDPTTVPDGEYQFKITASDRPGNPADLALTAARVSDPVTVDNTPPAVSDLTAERRDDGTLLIRANLNDALSKIAAAYVRLNGQKDWQYIAPADEIYDSSSEYVETVLDAPPRGPALIAIKVLDTAGNVVYGQRILTEKGPATAPTTQ